MSKTLKVLTPFFILKEGDVLQLTEDGKSYVFEHNEEFNRAGVNGETSTSSYNGTFKVSAEYAKELIDEGYVSEETEDSPKFTNVFEEIDNLLDTYTVELAEVQKDTADVPACLRIEKMTVLENLIKVLKHLKSLKK